VEQHSPEIFSLSEIKMSTKKARNLRFYLGFDNAIGIDSDGLVEAWFFFGRKASLCDGDA
jgi:hypothetical protein